MFQTTYAADPLQSEQTYSFWFSFFIAAYILLCKGLEALLIIITTLSLLQSLQAKKAIRWVHGGWITALVIGAASWFFTGWLISLGSQNSDIIAGIGSIVAVIILVYVVFWLHNKTEAKKWQQFVHTRITTLLDQKKLFGLASISFIVFFREAFESILFLSSMQMHVDENSRWNLDGCACRNHYGYSFFAFSASLCSSHSCSHLVSIFSYHHYGTCCCAYRARRTRTSEKRVDFRNPYPY
ncbi:MAG: FTR1 family protein [Bacteroidia bacterium]|nr:FTR1 family protein [Bacteroidia bacterium]